GVLQWEMPKRRPLEFTVSKRLKKPHGIDGWYRLRGYWNGKRVRTAFPTKEKAEEVAADYNERIRASGSQDPLPKHESNIIAHAINRWEVTLPEAITIVD